MKNVCSPILVTDEEIEEIREEMNEEIKEDFSVQESMPKRWVAFGPTSYSQSTLFQSFFFLSSSSAKRGKDQVHARKRHPHWFRLLGRGDAKRLENHANRG